MRCSICRFSPTSSTICLSLDAKALVPPSSPLDRSASTPPAARWDRASDRVSFDWTTIERTAAQHGPNQAMAKLLIAARAEGAQARWPL